MWAWSVVAEDEFGKVHEFTSNVLFNTQAECIFHMAQHVTAGGQIDQFFNGVDYEILDMLVSMNLN